MTQVDSRLSGYDVEEEVGRGDLTIIYRGHRKDGGLPVTIKVIAPEGLDIIVPDEAADELPVNVPVEV